ncbi:hypothetical protein GCM10025868_05180 [Angustibacter aerolatus]|uniref:Transketolase-like pyrimidine-binding domain-containing protein n=1 Tax=Angustibacter aerolatus TaxID=1162965 RepID=A0ABQ6JAS0_9ACTN|nr:hypothetical protein GCM10025868_05180 [Angustibacter aerolatus]
MFSDEMVRVAHERPDVVATTAAMMIPVGLDRFAAAYPERVFDVGIAEQHAATSAAGLAFGGLHPVVAVYATFLNRAFDQVLMDCALHRAGVTFVLDRAGVTGTDGASHNGMWDMSVLQVVPGLRIAAPRDATTLRAEPARGPRRRRRAHRRPVPERRGARRPAPGAHRRRCRRPARAGRRRRAARRGRRHGRHGAGGRPAARRPRHDRDRRRPPLGAARRPRPRRPRLVGEGSS